MPVYPAGFSERVFEFAFNAEYAHRNKALLASAPRIPTQNEEKWLGYDVEFEIKKRGGLIYSLCLQHKVARYVDVRAATNKHFWDAVKGPYFAFHLDTDQYNLIHSFAKQSLPGIEFYYCAPLFTLRRDMDRHYLAQTVEGNSIWLDVSKASQISDPSLHSITYSVNGAKGFRFSPEGIEIATRRPTQRRHREYREASLRDVRRIYEAGMNVVREYWPKRLVIRPPREETDFRMPAQLPEPEPLETLGQAIAVTGRLLSQYYGLTWLVETP
jgi:hypothetical protein